jgi:hypothetical protein
MKLFIIFALALTSTFSFASDCSKEALSAYKNHFLENEHHSIMTKGFELPAGENLLVVWGQSYSFDFSFPVIIFEASSEYWGGYGVDMLVMAADNCALIQVENIYAE